MIPILNLTRQYHDHKSEIDGAITGVLESGAFINGPSVKALEEAIARYVGTDHAVALNSGTDALHLAMRALGIGAGDEVITTPFTFVATSEAIAMVGATPIFVDIDPRTFNIDARAIESAVTPRTRAILPVHLYGLPAQLDEIVSIAQRHGLAVIEDCAQAIGAMADGRKVGCRGTIGCFSFFPSKNLGAFGDGGMITTNDRELADHIRRLRAHGAKVKYYHEEPGVNSRLDELQAAILLVKVRYLDEWIERRQDIAQRYSQRLSAISGLETPSAAPNLRHAYHQYTVRVAQGRDEVARELKERGVQTMIYYPVPLHLQPLHANLGLPVGAYPNTELAAQQVLSLPMFPELHDEEVDAVVRALEGSLVAAIGH